MFKSESQCGSELETRGFRLIRAESDALSETLMKMWGTENRVYVVVTIQDGRVVGFTISAPLERLQECVQAWENHIDMDRLFSDTYWEPGTRTLWRFSEDQQDRMFFVTAQLLRQ